MLDHSSPRHEFQNPRYNDFERGIGYPARTCISSLLIGRIVVSLEFHRRDLVDRSNQKIQQWKQQVAFRTPADHFGHKIPKRKSVEVTSGLRSNDVSDVG